MIRKLVHDGKIKLPVRAWDASDRHRQPPKIWVGPLIPDYEIGGFLSAKKSAIFGDMCFFPRHGSAHLIGCCVEYNCHINTLRQTFNHTSLPYASSFCPPLCRTTASSPSPSISSPPSISPMPRRFSRGRGVTPEENCPGARSCAVRTPCSTLRVSLLLSLRLILHGPSKQRRLHPLI